MLALLLASSVEAEPAGRIGNCLGHLGEALSEGGFRGSLDCVHDQLSVKKKGKVRRGGAQFDVYDYRYQLARTCGSCARHGGQRVIVVRDGRYIGQYATYRVAIHNLRNTIWLAPTDNDPSGSSTSHKPVKLTFTRAGPPRTVLVNGEIVHFFR